MTEERLRCTIEFVDVVWYHDEGFVIFDVVHSRLSEIVYSGDELLQTMRSMNDAIRVVWKYSCNAPSGASLQRRSRGSRVT